MFNFYVKGDYNMTPDRHLGAAWIGIFSYINVAKFKIYLKIILLKINVNQMF